MSYGPFSVASGIEEGIYTDTTQTFVFDNGTIGNTNYMGIAFNSPNKAGAMVVINAILSGEIQLTQYAQLKELPVVDQDKLSAEEKAAFDAVELGQGKALTERRIDQIDLFQKTEGLFYRSALSQDPGNKFKLGHIILSVRLFPIVGISNEIKPRHSQALFIYSLIIERIIVGHMGHADHGIVGFHGPLKTEAEGIVPWSDGHLVAKGKFIIQGPAKIKIFCLIGCCCTHKLPPV